MPTLIDAGVGKPEHVDAIARALAGVELAQVLITHGHPDHAGGAPALAARWPAVRIRRHSSEVRPIADGEIIEAGDSHVKAIHTPGHAADHLCFSYGDDLFCGDLARQGGTVVIPAGRGGDLRQYLDSLHRVKDLAPTRLLPGHGPIIDDPAALIDWYLRHRAEREAQIVEALEAGCGRPSEIVPRIYGTVAAELIKAAEESVLAHLIKLREDGRAQERDGVWVPAG